MTDHEKLIEATEILRRWREHMDADVEDAIETVLAVFEKVHAPTRTVPAPSPEHFHVWSDVPCRAGECRMEPQVKPTDDEREALSEFLFTIYEHGSQPNALREADAILAFLHTRRSEVPAPSVEEWVARITTTREKAIAKGYTPDHDAEHGIRHLLNWAIDYARRGRAEESSGLILSAMALLDAEPQGESTFDELAKDVERFRDPDESEPQGRFADHSERYVPKRQKEPQGEPSDAVIRQAILDGLDAASVLQSPFQPQTRELVVEQITLALRAGEVGR